MMIYLLLIILAAGSRLLPHLPNVAPIAAMGLLAGATGFQQSTRFGKAAAVILPFIALLISDAILGFYTWQVMVAVYLGFGVTAGLGWLVRRHMTWATIIGASLAGSLIFFLLTNAAVWAFTPMYSKTLTGLIESYTMALPFFRNSLFGDLAYTAVLFGAYQLAIRPSSAQQLTRLAI